MATKKRGISPLIASVLLIGFTIVLAALVFRWGGQLFQKTTSDTGCVSEGSIRCSQSVRVSIGSATINTVSDTVTITVLSEGDQQIKDFKVRLTKCSGETIVSDNVITATPDFPLVGYGSSSLVVSFDDVGTLDQYDPDPLNTNCAGKYSGVGLLPIVNFISTDGKQCIDQVCATEYKHQFLEADVS